MPYLPRSLLLTLASAVAGGAQNPEPPLAFTVIRITVVATPLVDLRSANGGGERDRTDDLLLAKQALSQLSYTPLTLGRPAALTLGGGWRQVHLLMHR